MNLSDININICKTLQPRLTCQLQHNDQIKNILTASKVGITNKTVRMSKVHSKTSDEIIRLFFSDYDIPAGNIKLLPKDRPLNHPDKTVDYIINFSTSYDAERAIRDKSYCYLNSFPVVLEHFNI